MGAVLGRTTISALVGGTVSEATGGKFANGAKTAALAHLVNQEQKSFAAWRNSYSRQSAESQNRAEIMKNQGKQAAKDYDAARNAIGETGRITGHASIAVGAAGIAFPLASPVTTPVSLGLGMVSTASNTFGTVMDYGSGNIEDALFNGASVAVDTGHDVIRQSILTTTLNLAPPQVKAGATTGLLFLDAMSNEIFYQAGKK